MKFGAAFIALVCEGYFDTLVSERSCVRQVSIMQFFAALISSVKVILSAFGPNRGVLIEGIQYELEGSTIVSPSLVPGFTVRTGVPGHEQI